ncbi:MAG: DUF1611 domain-containing protein [Desulfobacterium sp.]|nr:DUF1611 domain-containing protein [Desulfobacterium sp.]
MRRSELKKENAIVLTKGSLDTEAAKTAHGLIRGGDRFHLLAVIDPVHAGKDAGEVLDGTKRNIPVHGSIQECLDCGTARPAFCIIGVALPGGRLPKEWHSLLIQALENGISIVNPMHQRLATIPELNQAAQKSGAALIDVREPRPLEELHFWTGDIYQVKTPKIAVLGTDCALGKRTTCSLLKEACQKKGIRSEMIYTGQTGWMLGNRFGFILDSTLNDFVSGELEHAIVECDKATFPDCILIEGQSSLRNPSGPCGSEFILSGNVKGVILQHAPFRECFDTLEGPGCMIPSLADEIEIIRLMGARVIAICLNLGHAEEQDGVDCQQRLEEQTGIPVIRPLEQGMERLVSVIQGFIQADDPETTVTQLNTRARI